MKFKVGDIVEAKRHGRWLIGRVAFTGYNLCSYIAIEVFETIAEDGTPDLHECIYENGKVFMEPIGYWIEPHEAELCKNYIVKQIINDL